MTTIGNLNYRLSVDTNDFVKGATFARSEWNKLNRIFNETRTEAEKTGDKLLQLDAAVKKGQITAEKAAEVERRILANTQEAKEMAKQKAEAEKRLLDMEKEALSIKRSLMTAEDRYQEELKQTKQRVMELVQAGKLSEIEAKKHLATWQRVRPPSSNFRDEALQAASQIRGLGGIAGALQQITSSGTAIPAVGVGIGLVTTALYGSVKAAQAFTAEMASARQEIDDMTDAAAAMNMTIGELQKFQFSANMAAGIAPEKAIAAIGKLQSVIGDAVRDSEGDNVFTRLGLDANKLASMKPEQQLEVIADRFKQIPTAAEQARVAQELFGKGSIAMRQLLNEGSEGLKQTGREAERLGLILKDIDAAKVAVANDEITRMNTQLRAAKNIIAVETAPAFAILAEQVKGMTGGKSFRDDIGNWSKSLSVQTAASLGVLNDIGAKTNFWFSDITGRMMMTTEESDKLRESLQKIAMPNNALGMVSQFFEQSKKAGEEAKKQADNQKALTEQTADYARASEAAAKYVNDFAAMEKRIQGMHQERDAIGMTVAELAAYVAMKKEAERVEAERQTIADANRQADEEIKRLKADIVGISEEELTHARGVTKERLDQIDLLKQELAQRKKLNDEIDKAFDKFTKEKDEARDTAKRVTESLKTPMDKFMEDLDKARAAVEAGKLTRAEFKAYAEKQAPNNELDPSAAPKAVAFGSIEAYKSLVELQKSNVPQKQLEALSAIDEVLKKIDAKAAEQRRVMESLDNKATFAVTYA